MILLTLFSILLLGIISLYFITASSHTQLKQVALGTSLLAFYCSLFL